MKLRTRIALQILLAREIRGREKLTNIEIIKSSFVYADEIIEYLEGEPAPSENKS